MTQNMEVFVEVPSIKFEEDTMDMDLGNGPDLTPVAQSLCERTMSDASLVVSL